MTRTVAINTDAMDARRVLDQLRSIGEDHAAVVDAIAVRGKVSARAIAMDIGLRVGRVEEVIKELQAMRGLMQR